VLFAIDTSQSMIVVDPPDPATGQTHAERAAREAILALLDDPRFSTQIALVSLSDEARVLTFADQDGDGVADLGNGGAEPGESCFTADPEILLGSGGSGGVVSILGLRAGASALEAGLTAAQSIVLGEMGRPDAPPAARARYSVVLLTDLATDATSGGEEAVAQVREVAVTAGARGVAFDLYVGRIATGNATFDAAADDLGRRMAEAGQGTFQSFASASELDLLFAHR
jgi:hypothetical protein